MGKWPLNLPRGFRFNPTDVELITLFLISMITGTYDEEDGLIPEIDQIYKHEPWDLPAFSPIPREFQEWFFFTQPYLKHHNGNRKDRATKAGFWKSTGKDREIKSGATVIGMKKTLVFHTGRTPNGKGTCWVMHEYSTILKEFDGTNRGQKAFVLCRLFKREDSETKSKPTLASGDAEISPALKLQAETQQTSNPSSDDAEISGTTMCDDTAHVECSNNNDNYYNDCVAENRSEVDQHLKENQDKSFDVPFPADSTPITVTSSHEETQSMVAPASVSPALGWEADNCPTSFQCSSAEKAPIGYDDNGSFAYAAKKQVADVPADKVDPGSNMSQEPNGNYLPPLYSQMQAGLCSPCISYPGTNDLNSGHWEVYHQYGTNEPSPSISELLNTIDKVDPGSNMSQEPNGNYLPPLHSQIGFPYISYPSNNDLNSGHWEVYHKYGTNEPSPNISELLNTTNKVEPGSNMSQELNGNYLSPLHLQMQARLGSSCISCPGTNDLNNGHWGYHQSGTNEPSPYISELLNSALNDLDEWSRNNPSSQKNLFFDDGSCSGSDAKVADALFELKDGDYQLLADFINT